MFKKIIFPFLIILLSACYNLAEACSVCGADYSEEQAKAYTFITFLLILLPISFFAFLGVWLGRKYKHYDNENN
jgi:uncharacterized protein (DUF983 family)